MRQHEQALLFLKKAGEDEALLSEVFSSKKVSDEIFGFHCQQAAEKLLKALLSELGVDFPCTHNLRLLMDILADNGCSLPPHLANLDLLTPYGTLFRYEGLPEELMLDRPKFFSMILGLHELTEARLRRGTVEG